MGSLDHPAAAVAHLPQEKPHPPLRICIQRRQWDMWTIANHHEIKLSLSHRVVEMFRAVPRKSCTDDQDPSEESNTSSRSNSPLPCLTTPCSIPYNSPYSTMPILEAEEQRSVRTSPTAGISVGAPSLKIVQNQFRNHTPVSHLLKSFRKQKHLYKRLWRRVFQLEFNIRGYFIPKRNNRENAGFHMAEYTSPLADLPDFEIDYTKWSLSWQEQFLAQRGYVSCFEHRKFLPLKKINHGPETGQQLSQKEILTVPADLGKVTSNSTRIADETVEVGISDSNGAAIIPEEERIQSASSSPYQDEMDMVIDLSPRASSPTIDLSPRASSPTIDLSPRASSPTIDLFPRASSPTIDMDVLVIGIDYRDTLPSPNLRRLGIRY